MNDYLIFYLLGGIITGTLIGNLLPIIVDLLQSLQWKIHDTLYPPEQINYNAMQIFHTPILINNKIIQGENK